ncbi:MAG TPA: signal recognition particle protein [Chloroflexota bacterium]
MFESLSEKLQGVFQQLSRKGKLTEEDVDRALREVRLALLEADVHFRVVRDFVARVREKAVGVEVLRSLSPAQQVISIVHDELLELLGSTSELIVSSSPLSVYMLVGLQGSGKTTTAAKLALVLRKQARLPLLVAADPQRPAAVRQLEMLGEQVEVPVVGQPGADPVATCRDGVAEARRLGKRAVILDTAGRLQTDEGLMEQLEAIKAAVRPTEILLVADGATGQDALKVAEEFHARLGLTGAILTRLDGDARGGAALSLRAVTGVPIKFMGVGERMEALEVLHPDRLVSRILGMGDVLSLIERAQENVDLTRAQDLPKKLRTGSFDLEDLLDQFRQLRRMGPLDQLLALVPGMGRAARGPEAAAGEQDMRRMEAIILSMTPGERKRPDIIGGSRRRRIAKGSGTGVSDVNRLLNQFRQMQQLMKGVAGGRGAKKPGGIDLNRLFR